MKNLLQSDFYRLFKSKSFYICAAVSALLFAAGIFILDWSYQLMSEQSTNANAMFTLPYSDGISYALTVFEDSNVLMIIAIFTAVFITAEFSHGTMKNAVSKGFLKLEIYLSKLISMIVATLVIFLITFVAGLISGTIVMGSMGDFTGEFVGYMFKNIGIELLLNLALTAVLIMVAMIVKNLGGVIAIDIIGVMLFEQLLFQLLEFLVHSKIEFSKFSLMKNISFYLMNQTAVGSDYLRSTIVGIAFLVVASALGMFVFQKSDVK